jgi:hypothetical protein
MADLEYMLPGSLTSQTATCALKHDVFYGVCRGRIIGLLAAGACMEAGLSELDPEKVALNVDDGRAVIDFCRSRKGHGTLTLFG